MPRVVVVVSLVLACASAASGQARIPPGEPIPRAELEAFVDGMVEQAMGSSHIAGAAVSVVQGGEVVLNKGYGFADVASGRRVDPDTTLFRIGSITKTFTWIALMNAVEAGRIGLDDPVNTRLPADLQIPDDGFAEPIRIRHLMTHSAGFEDRMFGHLFTTDAAKVRPLATYLREERPRRVRAPDVLSSYSNYGVALAGAALEHVTGRRWQDIIETEILIPVGMRQTSVREPYPQRDDLPAPMTNLARQLSVGYRWRGVAHEPQAFEYITQLAPAGAISSTAGDMARYMRMLLAGGSLDGIRVFGDATAAALAQPMTSLPAPVGNWAIGFLEAPLAGAFRSVGHDGGSLLFFSAMVLVPELDLGIFISTNTAGGDTLTGPFAGHVVERFYGSPPVAASRTTTSRVDAATYQGYYLQTRRPYAGVQGFLFRLLARQVRVDRDGYLIARLMGPPQRFVPAGGVDEFAAVDRAGVPAVKFTRTGERATRIETPFMAFERVGFLRQPPMLAAPAVLTLLLAVGTLAGTRSRFRRDVSRTPTERLAAGLLTLSAGGWLTAAAAFALLAAALSDDESILFDGWPPASLLIFSTAALVAGVLAAGMTVVLPALSRQEGGWTTARKARYAACALVFVMFALLLAWWGALQPWNP